MKFVHPEILWALTALSIPVIVHLFNFRKFKKVFFPNVEFLKEIKQETQSKSKLKHLLILLARLLALACIIFAFAQPFIPVPGANSNPSGAVVSIYIDNSFSMEGSGKDGRLLEIAKNKAFEIVNSFQPSDKFQLLTGDFEGRHQRLVSREEMQDLIQEVQISPVSRKLSEVVSRQGDLLRSSGIENKRSFILTDLQMSVTDMDAVKNDTSVQVNLVPDVAANNSNLYIDSVWFDTPVRQLNQPEILHARIHNTGEENLENVPVQLIVNDMQRSVTSANVSSNSHTDIQVTYTNTEPGYKNCHLKLDDQFITKDDDYFFSYNVAEKIAVLNIKGKDIEDVSVAAVFNEDPYFAFTEVQESGIDYGAFSTENFIVLNQLKSISSGLAGELIKFVNEGGSLFIVPAPEIVINEYNSLLAQLSLGQIAGKNSVATKVSQVNYDHYIFKNAFEKAVGNVDLPSVASFYEITLANRSFSDQMMQLQQGSPFLVSSLFGNGRSYFNAVSLMTEESNFINHAFFPAIMLRMAEFSQPSSQLAYILGKEQAIELRDINKNGEEAFRLKEILTGQEMIPEHRNVGGNVEIFVPEVLNVAGNYSLSDASTQLAALAFNFDRTESNTLPFTKDEIKTQLINKGWSNWSILDGTMESISADASELNIGKKFWYALIIGALLFLAIEIILIRLWK